jgi:hypothetical protein
MERPAGRPLTWSAEKLPADNFLDFLFLQARGGPIGFQQASQAMRPEKPEAKVAGRQLGRSLIVVALLLPVLPRNLRAVFFSHLMTISSAQGQGKGVSSCIRILSDKARHEVVIITKHRGLARRHGGSVSRWKSSALPEGHRKLRTYTSSLSDRLGASLTCPASSSARVTSGIGSILGARRGLERPTMRRCRMCRCCR